MLTREQNKFWIKLSLVIIILYGFVLQAQTNCPNSNFSSNNFNGWSLTWGIATGVANSINPTQNIGLGAEGNHTIITTNGIDPNTCGGLEMIPPGASYSCKLGNNQIGCGGETMSYSFIPDVNSRLFTYEYAVILEDPPGHDISEKPRFIAEVIPLGSSSCFFYDTYGGSPINNFSYCGIVTYSNWKKVTIDLTPFLSTPISIRFTTMDCQLTGHYGYAYFTTKCAPFELNLQNNCDGGVTLAAPDGFDTYLWTPGGQTTQVISIDNLTTGNYTFSCNMNNTTEDGTICPAFMDTTFSFIQEEDLSDQDTTVCSDVPCGITINGPSTSTYNIISINSNSLSSSGGSPLVANGLLNSNLSDDAWTNTTNGPVNVIYTIIPVSSAGCEGNPFTVTIIINPEPIVLDQFDEVCSEELIGITLGNDSNGPNVQSWNIANILIGSALVPNSGNAPLGTTISNQYIAGDIYLNNSILDIDVIYTVLPNTNNNCIGDLFTVTITVNPLPVFNVLDIEVCADNYVTLAGNPSSYSYNWDHGISNNVPFIPPFTDTYYVIATDPSTGCVQDGNADVVVHPNPIANFTDICGSLPATLTNTSIGAVNYYWDMGDGRPIITTKDISYIYTIMDSMYYNIILIAETEFGCLDTVSRIFNTPLLFYVPNTFTPDGDEYNNTFIPVFSNKNKVESIHLLIYNRWGEIVFESENIDFGWDGTYKNRKAQDGTYTWELIFTDNSCIGKKEHLYGHVNLIR